MKVFDIQSEHRDGAALVGAKVEPHGGMAREVWFRVSGVEQAPTSAAEALTVALLAPCMYAGESLKVYGALSWTLARNLESAQDVLTTWHPRLKPIDVLASQFTRVWRGMPHSTGSACCFTAGVNCWYSLLKHDARVTHLLLIRGFDPALDSDEAWSAHLARVAQVARRLEKRLIVCETNLRTVTDPNRGHGDFWDEYLLGSSLSAVGLLLQREIGELVVPATHTYQRLKPWGSSPLLDPLWSTDRLAVVHDGCEASRAEKIAYIATSDAALESLHVCAHYNANCGSCDKCVATQVALRNSDALDRATTFPDPASLPSLQAIAEPIRTPTEGGGTITIPPALAVARYLARMMGEPNAVRELARGGPRFWRRIED
jgi:hypothetical protein